MLARIAVLATAALFAVPAAAMADTLEVTSEADSGTGSFREQVGDANPGDTVHVPAGNYSLASFIEIDKNLTITGDGARSTELAKTTTTQILSIDAGITVDISDLTLRGGSQAISNSSTLTLRRVRITGGGFTSTSPAGGAAINTLAGSVRVEDSLIDKNVVAGDPAQGGAISVLTPVTLVNTTVVQNAARGNADGDAGFGGGIYVHTGGSLTATNSTISDNAAGEDGSSAGGNIFAAGGVTLGNTIIAYTLFGEGGDNCAGTGSYTSAGHNLEHENNSCHLGSGELTNVTSDALRLEELDDNGGPTFSEALRAGSVAINAGDPALCPAADQRGVAREGTCDIGAYEFRSPVIPVVPNNPSAPPPLASSSVSSVGFSRSVFAAAGSGPSVQAAAKRRRRKAPVGTVVTYRLTAPATTTFTVERKARGRKRGRRCVKPTRKNRKRRRCTRYVKLRGSFSHTGAAGQNRFRFTGRLGGRKLRAGSYRLVAVARGTDGRPSRARRRAFRIVKR